MLFCAILLLHHQVHGGAGAHLDLDTARASAKAAKAGRPVLSEAVTPVRTIIFEGGVPYDKLQHGHSLVSNALLCWRPMEGGGCYAPCGLGIRAPLMWARAHRHWLAAAVVDDRLPEHRRQDGVPADAGAGWQGPGRSRCRHECRR